MFSKDDRVFLSDGREATYICPVDEHSHVVSIVFEFAYESDYDDFYGGTAVNGGDRVEIVSEVFAKPPVQKYAREYSAVIEERQKTIDKLRETVEELRKEESELTSNLKLIKKNSHRYPCIEQALDFLEERITHVVIKDYNGYSIKPFEEVINVSRDGCSIYRDNGTKLLCLFGEFKEGSKVKTKWRVNSYTDGSGSWVDILPCRSEEEAKKVLLDSFMQSVEAWREGFSPGIIQRTLDANPWISPPDDWVSYKEDQRNKVKNDKIEKLVKELSDLGVKVPEHPPKEG